MRRGLNMAEALVEYDTQNEAMSSELATQMLNLCGGDHLCLFYERDPGEQMPALVPFIHDGLCKDEQFIYIADDQTVDDLANRLEQAGINVSQQGQRGRLKLWTRQEWRQPGDLASDKKAAQVRSFIAAARNAGFKGVRFAVEMTWALGPDISADLLGHWEATINTLFTPDFPGRIVCQYNCARLAPDVLLAALQTHPLAILGEDVCPNLFYEAPLILAGDHNKAANNHGNGHVDRDLLRHRVEWMISQLRSARIAAKEREELLQKRAALAEAQAHRKRLEQAEAQLAAQVGDLQRLRARADQELEERKRSEAAAYQLAAIVESSDDAIIGKDLDGKIRSWNAAAERIFGYTAREMVGQSVTLLIPRDRQTEERRILQTLRRGERIEHYETVRRRKDGAFIDVSLTVSPIKDAQGQIIGVSKIARDITERKRVEAALRRSETLFRKLADSMPQIVWAARPDGHIDYYNMRWYEYTGFSEGREQENWKSILHPDDAQHSVAEYRRCIYDERPYQIEHRFKDWRTGDYRWFLSRALPVRDESGRVIRWFGTCTDIEDQKQAEEKLEKVVATRTLSLREAIAQMEEFSYTASHDLRAPLRAMQVYTEALMQDFSASLPAEASRYLERIAESAIRLDKMILDVLTFSRIARADLRLQRVPLDKLVRQIVEQYPGMQAPWAEISIAPLPDVLAHEPSLTQAVSNLLTNAVKFVPPKLKPEVRVWSEQRNSHVRLWIADNGIGVAPQYQHRLFNLFERIHPDLKHEGTGVGLAIVRKAVERMGGRTGMESDGANGSRFWIEISAAEAAT